MALQTNSGLAIPVWLSHCKDIRVLNRGQSARKRSDIRLRQEVHGGVNRSGG